MEESILDPSKFPMHCTIGLTAAPAYCAAPSAHQPIKIHPFLFSSFVVTLKSTDSLSPQYSKVPTFKHSFLLSSNSTFSTRIQQTFKASFLLFPFNILHLSHTPPLSSMFTESKGGKVALMQATGAPKIKEKIVIYSNTD